MTLSPREQYWHAHPDKVWKPIAVGRGAAEIGSFLLATRIVPMIQAFTPEKYDRLKKHFARAVVQPHAEWLERHIFGAPVFAYVDKDLHEAETKEKKAEIMAGAIIDLAVMTLGSVVGQGVTQSVSNRLAGLPELHNGSPSLLSRKLQHSKNIAVPILFYKVVNLGMVAVMQTGYPQATNTVTDLTSTVLQKTLGVSPDTTRYMIQWMLPNTMGAAASFYKMNQTYKQALSGTGLHATRQV